MSVDAQFVRYQCSDGIAVITLDRPESLNAVVPALVDQLGSALRRAICDGPTVAVLRGEGRAFCAGFDLKYERGERSELDHRRQIEAVQDVTRLVRRAEFPVLSAVQGYALGNGCEFALAADLVVAAEDAMFGFPEVEWGLSVTGGVSQLLAESLGPHRAKELLMLGEHFTAEQAHDWGLVCRVVPPADLDKQVRTLVRELASRPAAALVRAKRAVDLAGAGPMEAALAVETEHALLAGRSTESARAITGFGRPEDAAS